MSPDSEDGATRPGPPRSGPPPSGPPLPGAPLSEWFGQIDIYLFDQLLKGRFSADMRILDAGCGSGRNLVYLLRVGCDVFAVDRSAERVEETRALALRLAPRLPPDQFRVAPLDDLPFEDGGFDAVICSAVLHFADDEAQFQSMMDQMWRVLRPGGIFFSRLASTIRIEDRIRRVRGRRFDLPDGSERFLVDEALLFETSERLGGELLDPIKTTNVQGQRCMTTWCLRKP